MMTPSFSSGVISHDGSELILHEMTIKVRYTSINIRNLFAETWRYDLTPNFKLCSKRKLTKYPSVLAHFSLKMKRNSAIYNNGRILVNFDSYGKLAMSFASVVTPWSVLHWPSSVNEVKREKYFIKPSTLPSRY